MISGTASLSTAAGRERQPAPWVLASSAAATLSGQPATASSTDILLAQHRIELQLQPVGRDLVADDVEVLPVLADFTRPVPLPLPPPSRPAASALVFFPFSTLYTK